MNIAGVIVNSKGNYAVSLTGKGDIIQNNKFYLSISFDNFDVSWFANNLYLALITFFVSPDSQGIFSMLGIIDKN